MSGVNEVKTVLKFPIKVKVGTQLLYILTCVHIHNIVHNSAQRKSAKQFLVFVSSQCLGTEGAIKPRHQLNPHKVELCHEKGQIF